MIKRRKVQSSLDTYLGIPSKPSIFHLDWENNIATFLYERPLDVLWEDEFIWKPENRSMVISSTIASSSTVRTDKYPTSMIPLLKSHLQKCTRRGHSDLAIKTAKHLMTLDLNVFLRRWTIIVLEDSMLNYNYTLLVWLMVAVSKGFNPSDSILGWILGNVEATVCFPVKLEYRNYSTKCKLDSKSLIKLPNSNSDLIYALKLRQAYGGMKCDSVMIEDIIQTFLDMIDSNGKWSSSITENLSFPIHSLDISKVSDLELHEWELAAVDFHVSDIILKWWDELSVSDKEIWTIEDLKSCMWECSGSINHREMVNSCAYKNLWKKYSGKIQAIAFSILNQKMNSKKFNKK